MSSTKIVEMVAFGHIVRYVHLAGAGCTLRLMLDGLARVAIYTKGPRQQKSLYLKQKEVLTMTVEIIILTISAYALYRLIQLYETS